MLTAIEIFCCYAREDQHLLQRLKNHLMPLQRQGLIQIWSDTNINAGEDWQRAVQQHLETAEIILLLISSDFMASDYCYSHEMQRAMQRHEQQSARVIPIVLRHTYWRGAPFEKLKFLPTDAKPVIDRSWNEDEALFDVVEQIGSVVRTLRLKNMVAEVSRLMAEHRPEEALAVCEQAIVIEPEHVSALRAKADIQFLLRHYENCLETLEQVRRVDPQIADTQFHQKRAQALERLQRYDEARAAYDLALQSDPQNIDLLQEQATLLLQLQLFPEALTIYEKLSSLDTENAFYPEAMGDIFLRLQEPQKALDKYDQAMKYNPGSAGLHEKRGEILYALQRYKEAVLAFERAIINNPDNSSLYSKQGRTWFALKNYEEALDAYQISIDKGSSNPYNYYEKGQALASSGKHKEAIVAYEQALQLASPTPDPQFYHDLGTAYEYLAQQAYKDEQAARTSWKPATNSTFLTSCTPADNPQAIAQLHTLTDHTDNVWHVAFSPDGQLLASGGDDTTIKVWNPHLYRPNGLPGEGQFPGSHVEQADCDA